MFESLYDKYWYYIKGLHKYEKFLVKYQGYGNRSIIEFKRRNLLDWKTVAKILDKLVIVDGLQGKPSV